MVEGSTGARAVAMLKGMPQGTVLGSAAFALLLQVRQAALYQLLANAVKLGLIKKVHTRGSSVVGWRLGPGNDSATLLPRRVPLPAPTPEEIDRRARAAQRRAERAAASPPAPVFNFEWPPGFVPSLGCVSSADAQKRIDQDFDAQVPLGVVTRVPAWLTGTAPSSRATRRRPVQDDESCPSSYLARWLVHYAGEGSQFHSVIRVQSIDARRGRLKVWCEQQHEMRTFRRCGIRRAEDADRGTPVDLNAWWRKAQKMLPAG